MLLTICILFIKFAACTMMKRSEIHENFPDYSLRYKYPELCNTDSKQVSLLFQFNCNHNLSLYLRFLVTLNCQMERTFSFGSLSPCQSLRKTLFCFGSMEDQVVHQC